MSHVSTDTWLEAAQENFEQAITEDNLDLAEAVLQDMRDRGYGAQANSLLKVVNDEV